MDDDERFGPPSADVDPDEGFELLLEDLGAELAAFRMHPTPENEEDARRAFEIVISAVRPAEPMIRIENIAGVLVAYRGMEEIGPVHIVGGGVN
jgi:aminoglycoside/choline kinase family phosphotransferase